MFLSLKKLIVIGFVLFFLVFNRSARGASEPSNMAAPGSEPPALSEKTNSIFTKALIERLDILLGFVLGLCGTVFVDFLRKRQRINEFRRGVRSELKKLLGMTNWLIFNPDARLSGEKIRCMQNLFREFNLYTTLNPLGDSSIFNEHMSQNLTEQDVQQIVDLREASIAERARRGVQQGFTKLDYTFIQNNISSIALLSKEDQVFMMNILRRLEAMNAAILRLTFCFQKSYDTDTIHENWVRLTTAYQQNCQFISDWSLETSKEIAAFLRKAEQTPGAS